MSDSAHELVRGGIWAGVVAPVLYALIVLIGGLTVPGYDMLAEPISGLTAAGRTGIRWIEAGLALYNVLVIVFAASMLVLRGRCWRWVSMGLAAIGVAGLLMWPFTMDLPGAGLSAGGVVHIGLAALASLLALGVALGASLIWLGLNRTGLAAFCAVCFAVQLAVGMFAAIGVAGGWPLAGLLERVTVGTFQIWLLVTALALIVGNAGRRRHVEICRRRD